MAKPTSEAYNKQKTPYRINAFNVEVTRVTGLWPRRVYVQWILRKPSVSSGYTFQVYRSGSPSGPWEQVGTDLVDTYNYLDDNFTANVDYTTRGQNSMRRALYYRVTVSGPDGDAENIHLLEAGLDRRRQGIARKLRRDASVMLKKGSGTEVAVFKRKWTGEKCDCRTLSGQITRSHCSKCEGTGVVTGYYDPVYGYAKRSATPVEVETTSKGSTETHYNRVIMMNIPEVSAKDILVFLRDNKRYIINRVTPTEIHTVCIHQELDVSELAHSSVEYNLTADRWHDPEWF